MSLISLDLIRARTQQSSKFHCCHVIVRRWSSYRTSNNSDKRWKFESLSA